MNKYHIELKLRTDRQNTDGTHSIILYVNLNSKVKYFTTNQSVFLEHWNESKQEVYARADNWSKINATIKIFKQRAESFISLANAENRIVTALDIERILRNSHNTNSYFDFVEKVNRETYG